MSPRTLKWLHRIGYVCTALILAESIYVAYLVGDAWLWQRRAVANIMHRTRTMNGAIPNEDIRKYGEFGNFTSLPSLASLKKDGIRFIGHAEDRPVGYALVIDGSGKTVRGILRTTEEFRSDGPITVTLKDFTMPQAAYDELTVAFDKLADGYPGDRNACFDGLFIAFERVRASGIISGRGNGACSDHYKKISTVMLSVARQYAGLDVNDYWMPKNLGAPKK